MLSAPRPVVAHDEPANTTAAAYKVTGTSLLELWGRKEDYGAWYVPPLPPLEDRMQSVHVALLPEGKYGKVLIVNGSSFRIKYNPANVPSQGTPFEQGVDGTDPYVVDNTGVYDPAIDLAPDGLTPLGKDAFRRIPSPPTGKGALRRIPHLASLTSASGPDPDDEDPTRWANDLFCSGHLQTPDGNVLFVSGNRMLYPSMNHTGTRFANVFDWRTRRWLAPTLLKDGHWYPTLVELADGRIASFSGLSYKVRQSNSNSSIVEFYDPAQPPDKAWTAVDIRTLENSPFNARITDDSDERDRMDHYPRIFPLADGRLFITGDGSGAGNTKSRNTYFMTIKPSRHPGCPPEVSFELGPKRLSDRRVYGTAMADPNSPGGDILLIGGVLGGERSPIGPGFPPLHRFDAADPKLRADAVTANLERFHVPTPANPRGSWELVPHFLGDRPDDVRIMHVATILPTKQFLIMGGGNFAFHQPILSPQLFTHKPGAPGGYEGRRMNPGTQPRLYHSTSLLLPDGRIFVSGGNAVPAAIEVKPVTESRGGRAVVVDRAVKGGRVVLNTHRDPRTDVFNFAEPGRYSIPAEIHQFEIFYPPYLFAGKGQRPEILGTPASIGYGKKLTFRVNNMFDASSKGGSPAVVLIKLGSVTHAFDCGQRLCDLPPTLDPAAGTVTVETPRNRNLYPPGYYMLFYLNNSGRPSIAPFVRLEL
jgi:hypothetical protein